MTVKDCIDFVESRLEVRYATENGAYRSGKRIRVRGCVNHSYGAAQPSLEVLWRNMNRPGARWGVNAILGDFHLGDGRVILALPMDTRPWGVGGGEKGSWNDSRIQWEVAEPAGHTYSGGTMVGYDVEKNSGYFARMWRLLVAWNVYVLTKMGYGVEDIADHAEAHAAGYGSNHSDMGQWLPKHGKSMDDLRREVRLILENGDEDKEDEDLLTGREIYERLSEYLAGQPAPEWAEAQLKEARELGITDGSGPMLPAPRYQAAIMALRAAKASDGQAHMAPEAGKPDGGTDDGKADEE